MKNNNPKHGVFVSPRFMKTFDNFSPWCRNGNENGAIFDCISVQIHGAFLDIVAVHQTIPDIEGNINIWIPLSEVEAVVLDSPEKFHIGFAPKQQDDNDQGQVDHSP